MTRAKLFGMALLGAVAASGQETSPNGKKKPASGECPNCGTKISDDTMAEIRLKKHLTADLRACDFCNTVFRVKI